MPFFTPSLVERSGTGTRHDLPTRRIADLADGTAVTVARSDPADDTEFWDIGDALGLPVRERR